MNTPITAQPAMLTQRVVQGKPFGGVVHQREAA
jgi:hypothetical protein